MSSSDRPIEAATDSIRFSAASVSAPGKTFLIGEYLALEGGPSVLLATAPRFVLEASRQGKPEATSSSGAKQNHISDRFESSSVARVEGISPGSPGGRLLERFQENLNGWSVRFQDPHAGRGGLGASSAQFVLVLALIRRLLSEATDVRTMAPMEILQLYRACAWNGQGTPPSGADVICHLTGQVTLFDGRTGEVEGLTWPFADISFTMVRTGHKLATHEHLAQRLKVPMETLSPLSEQALQALRLAQADRLLESVRRFSDTLEAAQLLAAHSRELLQDMRKIPGVLAAKGCGAMGADVLLVFHERGATTSVRNWVCDHDLIVCGGDESLSSGLEMETREIEGGGR